MHAFYVAAVYLHILAAVAWVGGMLFFTLVLVPLLRRPQGVANATELVHLVGRRFRSIGWACIVVLIVSGVLLLGFRAQGAAGIFTAAFWASSFGSILAIKISAIIALVAMSAIHDFWVGPKATQLSRIDRNTADAISMRRWAGWLGRANLAIALGIIALAVLLVRGSPF